MSHPGQTMPSYLLLNVPSLPSTVFVLTFSVAPHPLTHSLIQTQDELLASSDHAGSVIAQDAFAFDFTSEALVYAFPPFHLLRQLLAKIRQEGFPCILILPDWIHALRPMMNQDAAASLITDSVILVSRFKLIAHFFPSRLRTS